MLIWRQIFPKSLAYPKKAVSLQPQKGTLPEWLGIGLQNRGRRFESARYLTKPADFSRLFVCPFRERQKGNKKRVPSPKLFCLSHMSDSNQRPTHYECVALPTELKWPLKCGCKNRNILENETCFFEKSGKNQDEHPANDTFSVLLKRRKTFRPCQISNKIYSSLCCCFSD